ncbi:enoyl-ACP reductase FabI [Jeotgalibacillus proteolyticus]|uniref:Enoyl-[acyl-carrier-protein] reductase [NADH] n=1 Tax=Jeotgalibacillus proteolyticus TaxID=2082395 RepID=A0A2S5G755_9BACL|nr:enoyl-ACP reductase [Jeotgalibacillus proteolyticus]PPA68718.1 NADH-specific enoyl-ACP reductase [Jeotgalibacillus proteolyticus]PPA68795.1 NADH-specific enoyl-ACP reductase [Jeotgalibacillus proteolyticus]
MNLINGKNILVMGVANERSIAWAIVKSLNDHGQVNFILTYENEKIKNRILKLTKEMDNVNLFQCNVTEEIDLDNLKNYMEDNYGTVHGIVHSIAFANREDLDGRYVETKKSGYDLAQHVSAYSLLAVTQRIYPLMSEGGSIVAMTYIGSQRVVKNYNVMGIAKASLEANVRYLAKDLGEFDIRVNSISSGPIRTLSGKGIAGFNTFIKAVEDQTILGRSVDPEEVGNTALFLISDLSKGITGQTIYVDHGFNIVGV